MTTPSDEAIAEALGLEPKPEGECMWFLNCTRDATTTAPHPILGDVPTCDSCHEFATGGKGMAACENTIVTE